MKTALKTLMLIFLLEAIFCLPAGAQIFSHKNIISVSGDAELWVVPDKAIINAGVEKWDTDLDTAVFDADKRMTAILNLAQKYNLEPRHIRTEYIDLQPSGRKIKGVDVSGYMVQRSVSVTLTDLLILDDILHDIVKAGVNRIHNVQFFTTELKKYRNQCRSLAINAARDKAENLSRELGQKIGKAKSIAEGRTYSRYYGYNWWRNYGRYSGESSQTSMQVNNDSASEMGETVSIGQIRVYAQIQVRFELK